MRTVISDESLDIPHDVCIALLSCSSHCGQAPVLNSIVCCSWLGVEDERYGEKRLGKEWASVSASAGPRSTSGNTRARIGVQRLSLPEARRASQRSGAKTRKLLTLIHSIYTRLARTQIQDLDSLRVDLFGVSDNRVSSHPQKVLKRSDTNVHAMNVESNGTERNVDITVNQQQGSWKEAASKMHSRPSSAAEQ
jgi:hypothetical protein